LQPGSDGQYAGVYQLMVLRPEGLCSQDHP
jgi:hypothetical protein